MPSSSIRSGFGPCVRLTCPTYFGEAAGSELQQDVLVAIMGFIYGVEVGHRERKGEEELQHDLSEYF